MVSAVNGNTAPIEPDVLLNGCVAPSPSILPLILMQLSLPTRNPTLKLAVTAGAASVFGVTGVDAALDSDAWEGGAAGGRRHAHRWWIAMGFPAVPTSHPLPPPQKQ